MTSKLYGTCDAILVPSSNPSMSNHPSTLKKFKSLLKLARFKHERKLAHYACFKMRQFNDAGVHALCGLLPVILILGRTLVPIVPFRVFLK